MKKDMAADSAVTYNPEMNFSTLYLHSITGSGLEMNKVYIVHLSKFISTLTLLPLERYEHKSSTMDSVCSDVDCVYFGKRIIAHVMLVPSL